MEAVKYLLIGGGIGAYSAIKRIRRTDPGASVMLVGDDRLPPYNLPPLSKNFLRGEIDETGLVFESLDKIEASGVALRLGARVLSIDPLARSAVLDCGAAVSYEKAFISTGARPRLLEVPGSELEGIHYLRTADDAIGLARDCKSGANAAIIGAGFIGLEVAATLTDMGLHVTVFEAMPRVCARFGDEILATYIRDYCERRGVRFEMNQQVASFSGDTRVSRVVTTSGLDVAADVVCIGIGAIPNVELARDAGLDCENGIVVDEFMRTSDPHIYAGGDAANYRDPLTGERRRTEHWGHAEYCGQVAGNNMTGGSTVFDCIPYVWSDIFDLHIEAAGPGTGFDQTVVRGDMASGRFVMLYLRDGALSSYVGINADPKEFTVLRRLIRNRTPIANRLDALRDPKFKLSDLA